MDQFEAAFDYLDRQEQLNYTEAAKIFGISRWTLRRRYTGKSDSRQEANSKYRQKLNDVQEDTLLRYIDQLTKRNIPPTNQIITNLAEEILKGPVGKNWASNFVKRHSERICSVYLKPIDHCRASSESAAIFEQFYAFVLFCFGCGCSKC